MKHNKAHFYNFDLAWKYNFNGKMERIQNDLRGIVYST